MDKRTITNDIVFVKKISYKYLLNIFFPQLCDGCQEECITFFKPMCILCLNKLENTLLSKDNLFSLPIIGTSKQEVYYVLKYQFLSTLLLERAKRHQETSSLLYILKLIEKKYFDFFLKKKIDYYSVIPSSSSFIQSLSRRFFESKLGIKHVKLFHIQKSLQRQKDLSRENRFQNIYKSLNLITKNSFNKLQNKKLLIVDDVYTTGATMKQAHHLLEYSNLEECMFFTIFARERQF